MYVSLSLSLYMCMNIHNIIYTFIYIHMPQKTVVLRRKACALFFQSLTDVFLANLFQICDGLLLHAAVVATCHLYQEIIDQRVIINNPTYLR